MRRFKFKFVRNTLRNVSHDIYQKAFGIGDVILSGIIFVLLELCDVNKNSGRPKYVHVKYKCRQLSLDSIISY